MYLIKKPPNHYCFQYSRTKINPVKICDTYSILLLSAILDFWERQKRNVFISSVLKARIIFAHEINLGYFFRQLIEALLPDCNTSEILCGYKFGFKLSEWEGENTEKSYHSFPPFPLLVTTK